MHDTADGGRYPPTAYTMQHQQHVPVPQRAPHVLDVRTALLQPHRLEHQVEGLLSQHGARVEDPIYGQDTTVDVEGVVTADYGSRRHRKDSPAAPGVV